jgi:hypothetical protein
VSKMLTIAASNRDRFDLETNSTKWFIKSLANQTCQDFELIIADGGSKNVEDIKQFAATNLHLFSIKVVCHQLGEKFERSRLNNVGVRNATTPYIMTTDVDMFFAKDFVATLVDNLKPHVFVESRTMYWKPPIANQIYSGALDPINNLEDCKHGRIKKRTSAGGCQCTSIENWHKLRGFNEAMVGWGSEDVELLKRAKHMGLRILWMGESRERIMVFHQPHAKIDINEDLKCQNVNKRIYASSDQKFVNSLSWGGKYEDN